MKLRGCRLRTRKAKGLRQLNKIKTVYLPPFLGGGGVGSFLLLMPIEFVKDIHVIKRDNNELIFKKLFRAFSRRNFSVFYAHRLNLFMLLICLLV